MDLILNSNLESSGIVEQRGSGGAGRGSRGIREGMVLEQQDSGVCLSTEPGSPTNDDPAEFRCSREGGTVQRKKLSGLVDGLERLKTSKMEEGGGKTGEGSVEGLEELGRETEARGLRLAETMPDLSEGRGGEKEMGWDEDERRMEGGGRGMAGVRCHHHLLLASEDQDNDNEPRICQICR